jgi:hypothetical protein
MSEPFEQRQLFMHQSHGRVGVCGAAIWADGGPQPADSAGPPRPLRVCLLGGDDAGQHAQALITACLYADGRVECCETWGDRYNTLGTAADYDCLVLSGRPSPESHEWCREQLERYRCHGGGIVALGAAVDVLPTGQLAAQIANLPVAGDLCRVEPADDWPRHPILRGVEPYRRQGDLSSSFAPADDATILVWGRWGDTRQTPLAWLRRHGRARLFCTPLGHDDDFAQADFLQLLANAVCWAGQ